MMTTLLQEWKARAPAPRFSKNSLERDSAREFESLVRKGILVYDLPSGQESIYDSPSCRYGCSLFVEEVDGKWEGVCLEHPEEGSISVKADQLNRYRFSVENLIKGIRAANELEGEIVQCGRGYYFGHKIYSGKKIGLAIFPSVTKYNLSSLSEAVAGVKEYDCIFVIAPSLYGQWSGTIPSLGDRVALMDVYRAIDSETLEILFDWNVFKFERKNVSAYDHFEFTGDRDLNGHKIRINGSPIHLAQPLFAFLLRLASGAVTKEGRWVSVDELIADGVVTEENWRRVAGRFKEFQSWVKWDKLIENDQERYRFSPSVSRFVFNHNTLTKGTKGA